MDALDFFPEIEAGGLPVVGDVLQVGLDDGVGGEAAVVEGGGDVGLLPGVQHHICKLDEDSGADGGAVELRTAPVPGEGTAADEELGLADATSGVGAAGVAGLLQLVVRGGIGLEHALEGGVPVDVLVEEDFEDHGRIAGPLEVAGREKVSRDIDTPERYQNIRNTKGDIKTPETPGFNILIRPNSRRRGNNRTHIRRLRKLPGRTNISKQP